MTLVVTNLATNVSKRFYSADLGQWSIEKAARGISARLRRSRCQAAAGHTDVVLFHARTDETVMQIVRAAGRFRFMLTLDVAGSEDFGFLDRLWRSPPEPLRFEMVLPEPHHRAFTSGSGTVALHQKDWQSSVLPGLNDLILPAAGYRARPQKVVPERSRPNGHLSSRASSTRRATSSSRRGKTRLTSIKRS